MNPAKTLILSAILFLQPFAVSADTTLVYKAVFQRSGESAGELDATNTITTGKAKEVVRGYLIRNLDNFQDYVFIIVDQKAKTYRVESGVLGLGEYYQSKRKYVEALSLHREVEFDRSGSGGNDTTFEELLGLESAVGDIKVANYTGTFSNLPLKMKGSGLFAMESDYVFHKKEGYRPGFEMQQGTVKCSLSVDKKMTSGAYGKYFYASVGLAQLYVTSELDGKGYRLD